MPDCCGYPDFLLLLRYLVITQTFFIFCSLNSYVSFSTPVGSITSPKHLKFLTLYIGPYFVLIFFVSDFVRIIYLVEWGLKTYSFCTFFYYLNFFTAVSLLAVRIARSSVKARQPISVCVLPCNIIYCYLFTPNVFPKQTCILFGS